MRSKDPADFWKDDSDAGSPWESPPLVFFKEPLEKNQNYHFSSKIDPANCIKVRAFKNGVPRLDVAAGLFKRFIKKGVYLGTIDECPWLPEDLRHEGFVGSSSFKGVFIGKAGNDKELYVFVLLITYKSDEERGYGDGDDLEYV